MSSAVIRSSSTIMIFAGIALFPGSLGDGLEYDFDHGALTRSHRDLRAKLLRQRSNQPQPQRFGAPQADAPRQAYSVVGHQQSYEAIAGVPHLDVDLSTPAFGESVFQRV